MIRKKSNMEFKNIDQLSEYTSKSINESIKECVESIRQHMMNDVYQALENIKNDDSLKSLYGNKKLTLLERIRYKLIKVKNKIFKRNTDNGWYTDDEWDS